MSKSLVQISKLFYLKIVNIFLPISVSTCIGCSKEPSHRDGSFEHPQHISWLKNKKDISQLALLSEMKRIKAKYPSLAKMPLMSIKLSV